MPIKGPWVTSFSRKLEWTYVEAQEQIGQGSFGVVRTATARSVSGDSFVGVWSPFVGEEVVVKHVQKAKVAAFKEVVAMEIKVFKMLTSHPGFPKLYDVFEDKDSVLLVMEYCRGGELTDAIATLKHLSEACIASVFQRVVSAVAYMHSRELIHRDLKPANFLLAVRATSAEEFHTARVCCADFGLAQGVDEETKLSDSSGTLDFMAPEQLGKSTYKGKPADVWSCGCILFMLLSGRLPFEGPSRQIVQTKIRGAMFQFEPVAAWEKVSDSAKDLIRKMMSLDWEHRLTAEEVLDHPWFEECASQGEASASCRSLDSTVVTHLQAFQKWNAVKKGLTFQLAKHLATLTLEGDNGDKGVASRLLHRRLSNRQRRMSSQHTSEGGVMADEAAAYSPPLPPLCDEKLQARMVQLRGIFDSLDTEGTGVLNQEQLKEAMNRLGFKMGDSDAGELIESLDANGNHLLDYEEFLAGTLRLQIHEHNSLLETILKKYDINDDGRIHIDDLRQVLSVTTDDDEECLQAFIGSLEMDDMGNLDYMEFLHVFSQDE